MEGMRSVPEAEHHPGSVSSHKGRRFAEMPGASPKHIWESKQKNKAECVSDDSECQQKESRADLVSVPVPPEKNRSGLMLMLLPDFSPIKMLFRFCSTMRGNVRRVHNEPQMGK